MLHLVFDTFQSILCSSNNSIWLLLNGLNIKNITSCNNKRNRFVTRFRFIVQSKNVVRSYCFVWSALFHIFSGTKRNGNIYCQNWHRAEVNIERVMRSRRFFKMHKIGHLSHLFAWSAISACIFCCHQWVSAK